MRILGRVRQKVELTLVSPPGKRAKGSDVNRELSLGQSDNIAEDRDLCAEHSFKMFYLGKKNSYSGTILVDQKVAKVLCTDSSLTQLLPTFYTAMV